MGTENLTTQIAPSIPKGVAARRYQTYIVPSDYMAPTLQSGDLAEIDTAVAQVQSDGIYLLAFPTGDPALRRVQIMTSGRARISCDRTPQDVEQLDSKELRVLGRAIRALCGHSI